MISPEHLAVLTRFEVVPNATIVDLSYSPARTFSTDDANTRIRRLSRGLQNLNLASDACVAIMSHNSYEYMCLWLALSQLGLTTVPINIKLPLAQVHYCLEDSGASLILYTPEFKQLVPDSIPSYEIYSDAYEALLDDSPYTRPQYDENKINYIMYTSGTTGNPKGVSSSYKNRTWSNYYGYIQLADFKDRPFRSIHVSPLYHLAGTNGLLNTVTLASRSEMLVVIQPKFNAKEYLQAISDYKLGDLRLVAPMMSMILAEKETLRKVDLSSVSCILLTSSAAPEKMQREIKLHFKNVGQILNPYGLTESGPVFGPHPDGIPRPINSVGYPLEGIQTRIVDGVLQLKSNAILTSYHNNPEASNNVMTEDGFLITGDLFRSNKYGFYFYMGRADDMFKSGGEKIYPNEIEAIIDKHPAVATSAVVGVADDIKGAKPYAFVQLKHGERATGDQLKNYTVKNVATYQIPRQVWVLDELPKTTIGKIDRKLLAVMAKNLIASDNK